MGLSSSAASIAAQKAAELARREARKKGKTPEQKSIIDFLYGINDGGGCGCLGKSASPISMELYLKIVQNMCQQLNLRERAIRKIGLDESEIQEIPPIVLSSFQFDFDDPDLLVKVDNQIAVTNLYSITWIFFSATQMYTYKYVFDTTSDNTREITQDFFYRDITCFRTAKSVKEQIDITLKKGCLTSGENITKYHYVVDELEIIVPGTSYSFSLRDSDTIEQSIQAAKNMLREKKFSL